MRNQGTTNRRGLSFWDQFRLLTQKNLKLLWRNKAWTTVEIVIPLLLSIPIVYMAQEMNKKAPDITPAASYPPIEVSGDWADFNRNIGSVDPMLKKNCGNSIFRMLYSSSGGSSTRLVDDLMDAFCHRYNHNIYGMACVRVDSVQRMHELLRRSLVNESSCVVNGVFGGIEFTEVDLGTAKLAYKLWHPNEEDVRKTSASWHLLEKWIGGNPYYGKDFQALPIAPPYWSYGYLSFKKALDELFLKKYTSPGARIEPFYLQRFPVPESKQRAIKDFLLSLPLIYAFLIFPTVIHLAREISAEIEGGLKDYMRVMGLRSKVFYMTHGFVAWAKATVIFTICAYPIMSLLGSVPWHLVLFIIYLYSFAVIAFALLCSSIMRTSSNVMRVAIIGWMASIGAAYIHLPSQDEIFQCYFYSLNINHALRLTVEIMAEACNREYHLGWVQIFDNPLTSFNLAGVIVMLIFDFLWMTFVALVIDDMRTNSESYFFTFWRRRPNGPTDGYARRNTKLDEQIDFDRTEIQADVIVEGLGKMYAPGNWALDGMSLRAARGQITVLLGHNGAGKSTTFGIICGLIEPSYGAVGISERPVGLCPQKNSLFDKLTVRETIRFFHRLKGSSTNCDDEINGYLHALRFADKADELVENLSGGTKRKLCVAVAACGESRVVLLDEPTAGMDPGARRDIENLLQQIKPNRTILLTTHYMDEAERLGDWIYIMQAGRDVTNGSPEYLKHKYGTGFVLTLVSSAVNENVIADSATTVASDQVMAMGDRVLSVCANAIGTSASNFLRGQPKGRQIEITIPTEYKQSFPDMFKWVEKEIKRIRPGQAVLMSFGVSLNTLEQIFLKVGELGMEKAGMQPIQEGPKATDHWADDSLRLNPGPRLWWQQFKYLMWKRYLFTKRNLLQFSGQVTFPIALILLACFFDGMNGPDVGRSKALDFTAVSPIKCIVQSDESRPRQEVSIYQQYLEDQCARFLKLDPARSFEEQMFEEPKHLPALGVGVRLLANGTHAIFNSYAYHAAPAAMHLVANARLRHFTGKVTAAIHSSIQIYVPANGSESASEEERIMNRFVIVPVLILAFALTTSSFVMFHVEERASHFKHQQLLTKLHPSLFWTASIIYDGAIFFFVCGASIMLFWYHGLMNGELQYVLLLWSLYFWACCPLIYSASYFFESPSKASTILVIWQFVTSAFAAVVVALLGVLQYHEQLEVVLMFFFPPYAMGAGMSAIQDWSINAKRPANLPISGAKFTPQRPLWSMDSLGKPALLMFLFGINGMIFFYVLSSRYVRRKLALLGGRLPCINRSPGTAVSKKRTLAEDPALYTYDPTKIPSEYAEAVKAPELEMENLSFLCTHRSFPRMDRQLPCLNPTSGDVAARKKVPELDYDHNYGSEMDPFSSSYYASGGNLLVAPTAEEESISEEESIGKNENKKNKKRKNVDEGEVMVHKVGRQQDPSKPTVNIEAYEDGDVRNEKSYVERHLRSKLPLLVRNLKKVYNWNFARPAVDGLTFGVEKGQCFGLLGVNGAGKTTTIDIITQLRYATSGRVELLGELDASVPIGYCPQFDAVLLDLTGLESLELMACFHGYKEPRKIALEALEAVGMAKHGDHQLRTCSGGQRRKISVGIALLAQNTIRVLDEPTAGIDPKARRDIWKYLNLGNQAETAQLLTSHSMDECEALCTKIAIISRGKMTAIGSSQHLKSKYSTGYTLTLWLRWKKFADLKRPTKREELDMFEEVLREMHDEGKLPNAGTGEEMKGWQHRFVVRRLDRHIRGIFPGAAIREAGESLTVSWQIPPHRDATWSVLWGKLIDMAPLHNDLLIEDYNITQCSLEDTFLDLLSHEEQKHRDADTVYQQQSTGARYTPAPQYISELHNAR